YSKCYELAKSAKPKHEREVGFEAIKAACVEALGLSEEDLEAKKMMIDRYFGHEQREALRNLVLDEGLRVDGRQTTEVRPIWCEVDYLPCAHGSAVFTRGETQALASVTLGTKLDMKEMDEVLIQGDQQFILHYNFPPFATGEAKPQRSVGRREIGHGNLAYRALKAVMPKAPDFPYAVRVVSDILESNGSSSQASICGGCLAIMDAGVKITKPVAGVAMGLITDEKDPNGRYAILTDILGDEDHLGDMDFKVAGTEDGITATQMDIKVDGLSYDVLAKALKQAREGRMHIMGEMMKCIDKPREDYKPFVPRIISFEIAKEFIGAVIGKGGETIQKIQAETGAVINIDEVDGKGVVDIATNDAEAMKKAYDWIQGICAVPEVGMTYHGKIVSILEFGAFVEILPGKEGLLHVSEIAWNKTENVEDVLAVGQEVDVKLLEIDQKTGKMRLSMRALQPKPEGWVEPSRRPRGNGGGNGNGGERRPGGNDRGNDRRNSGNERRGGNNRERGERGERHGERRSFGHRNNNAPKERPEPANNNTEEYF
ncbi:MAG: polyribonucleotide nucleotidyltransferase, partial [Bacteroidales bacterium]|nr:polyribonucleotide nucleotidyltransferase [Bacteroidales bacterium]